MGIKKFGDLNWLSDLDISKDDVLNSIYEGVYQAFVNKMDFNISPISAKDFHDTIGKAVETAHSNHLENDQNG